MTADDAMEPREIATHLAATDLFSLVPPEKLPALAEAFSVTGFPSGHVVTRDGDIDGTLWVVVEGMVSVDRSGADGSVEQLAFGGYGTVIGEDGVFSGRPRRSNVLTVEPTLLLHADRERLWHVLRAHDLFDRLLLPDRIRHRVANLDQPATAAGEFQVGVYRRHWVVLARGWVLPFLVLIGSLLIGVVLSTLTSFLHTAAPSAVLVLALLGLGVPAAGFVWAFYDYYQDCLIVTNRRVIHIERKPMVDARRVEAPLGRVQDVNVVTPNLSARLFRYGDITVQTAAARGAIHFRMVPWPEHVRDTIFTQAARARDDERRERQSWIDDQVRLAIGRGAEWRGGERSAAPREVEDVADPILLVAARFLGRALAYFWPKMRVQEGGVITWRKHWWRLVRTSMVPLALLLGTNLVVVALVWRGHAPSWIAVGVIWLVLGVWLLWRYENWRNDLYQLTDEHVIDVERLPLGMFGERRQASLGQVQDVRYVVPNPLATVLNYGNVAIQTAAETGEFTFDYVFNPAAVQEEIVARIDAYRDRQLRAEEEQRAREWSHWLSAYHRLAGQRIGGDQTTRTPGEPGAQSTGAPRARTPGDPTPQAPRDPTNQTPGSTAPADPIQDASSQPRQEPRPPNSDS